MADYDKIEKPSGSGEPQSPIQLGVLKPHTPAQTRSKYPSSYSARPRVANKNDTFNELYGRRDFVRFYSVKPSGESDLTKLNMFKVDKAIKDKVGNCEKISEDYKNKSWTVEVKTKEQGTEIMKMRVLLSEPITVTPHQQYNQSQGVITCALLKGYSDKDISEGLSEHGVIDCRRIVRKPKSPNPEPTTTLILTFNSSSPPDKIVIRTGLVERVRPYIPLPRRCYNCQNYGHSGAKCRKEIPVCTRCGMDMEEGHTPNSCQLPVNCVHCKENHEVSSKSCPRYILEKEILALKTKEHLTFAEARARIILSQPAGGRSYASATRQVIAKRPHGNDTTDINNNTTIESSKNTATSIKRPLQRNESPSPEKTKEKRVRQTELSLPKLPNISSTNKNCEEMEITRPPEDTTRVKRNSAPNIFSIIRNPLPNIENDILNSIRKEKKREKKQTREKKKEKQPNE